MFTSLQCMLMFDVLPFFWDKHCNIYFLLIHLHSLDSTKSVIMEDEHSPEHITNLQKSLKEFDILLFWQICCCSTWIHPPQLNLYSSEDKIPFLLSTVINVSPGAGHSQCQIANSPKYLIFVSNRMYLHLVHTHSPALDLFVFD